MTGIIRSVEQYGVFIELTPNLAGLTELREEFRAVAHRYIGHTAAVYIKSICPERMKIKLVLIDTYPDMRPLPELQYAVPKECTHMDQWLYSPPGCQRRIETVFSLNDT